MEYKFYCESCGNEQNIAIPMDEYDNKKNCQTCKKCGKLMKRKIEFTGFSSGSGDGWFGKSNGETTI